MNTSIIKNMNNWELSTTDHIGRARRPENPSMWVTAWLDSPDFAARYREGVNFFVKWDSVDGWMIENWIEPLDDIPECLYEDSVLDSLYHSPNGVVEVQAPAP